MAEHRMPVPGDGARHGDGRARHDGVDPACSPDPAVDTLVAALGTLQLAPPPEPQFRADLRAQLVAVAPRLVAEGPLSPTSTGPHRWQRALARLRLGRRLRVATAALAVLAVAFSGTVWLSRSALPGDALYGLKRAGESARFSLTSGSVARGKELLTFAQTRADEVSDLLGQPGAAAAGPDASGISANTSALVHSTLGAADDDLRKASRLLDTQTVRDRTAAPATVLTDWAPGQLSRLNAIVAHIPAGALHQRAAQSAALVTAAYVRAQQLAAQVHCSCLGRTATDDLGPLPCGRCGTAAPSTQVPTTRPPADSRSATDHGTPAHSAGTTSSRGSIPGGSSSTRTAPGVPLPTPGGVLPTLPPVPGISPSPAPTSSCGPSVSLGPILIGVGSCGVGVHI